MCALYFGLSFNLLDFFKPDDHFVQKVQAVGMGANYGSGLNLGFWTEETRKTKTLKTYKRIQRFPTTSLKGTFEAYILTYILFSVCV